jgi:hypothetical protein
MREDVRFMLPKQIRMALTAREACTVRITRPRSQARISAVLVEARRAAAQRADAGGRARAVASCTARGPATRASA